MGRVSLTGKFDFRPAGFEVLVECPGGMMMSIRSLEFRREI